MDLAQLLSEEFDAASFAAEDLTERRLAITAAVREAHAAGTTSEVVELIRTGVGQVKSIDAEIAARAALDAQSAADADALVAELGDETDTGPIAASRGLVRGVNVPARSRPRSTTRGAGGGFTLVASGAPGRQAFNNLDEVHAALYETWSSLRHSSDVSPHTVASIDYTDAYPAERRIGGGDAFEVSERLLGYVADRNEQMRTRSGGVLLASGGVPGPPEPNYAVITFGQADRPLRDGLPSVLMRRGSTIYNISPVLSSVLLDTAAGAIGTVTSAQDLATATKNVQEVPAPVQKTVTVEAETMRWSQGNFADRFLPEWFAGFMKLGQVAFARHNEALRLADIKTNCTQYTDSIAHFGAYRDLKRQVLGEMEQLEDLIRDFSQPMCLLLPEYVPALLATDLIAQQPGDEAYNVTEESVRADVESWDPSLHVIWLKDSIRGRLTTTPGGQSPRSPGFDEDVEWALFPEGAFVYGDGGQLDLGILRDTVVSATNRFQTFYEGWECILPLVDKSICFWNTSSLCANGASQAAAAVTGTCEPQGS